VDVLSLKKLLSQEDLSHIETLKERLGPFFYFRHFQHHIDKLQKNSISAILKLQAPHLTTELLYLSSHLPNSVFFFSTNPQNQTQEVRKSGNQATMPPPNNPSSRIRREPVRGYFSDNLAVGTGKQHQKDAASNSQNSQIQYQQTAQLQNQQSSPQPHVQQQLSSPNITPLIPTSYPRPSLQDTIARIQHHCLSHQDTPQEFNLLSLLSGLECVPFDSKPTPPFYSTSLTPLSNSTSQQPGGQELKSQAQGQNEGKTYESAPEAALMALSDVWGINEERLQKAKLSMLAVIVAESSQLVRSFSPPLYSPFPPIPTCQTKPNQKKNTNTQQHGAEWGAFLRWIYEIIGGTLGWIEECDRNTKSPQPAKIDEEVEMRTEQETRARRSRRQKRA